MGAYSRSTEFGASESLIHATGDVVFTDVIDFAAAAVKHFAAPEIYIEIETAVDSTGDGASVAFNLQDSADNSSFATIATTGAIAEATLVEKYKPQLACPKEHRRYLRLIATITGEAVTAGAANAHLNPVA